MKKASSKQALLIRFRSMNKVGGITKRGDRYLRKQLIHSARALVSRAAKSNDPISVWAMKLRISKPFNQVAVAVAHRLARLMWILLSRQEHYQIQFLGWASRSNIN